MSPERIAGLQYHYNSDVWSFGIAMVEILLGRFPYYRPGIDGGVAGERFDLMELLDRYVCVWDGETELVQDSVSVCVCVCVCVCVAGARFDGVT